MRAASTPLLPPLSLSVARAAAAVLSRVPPRHRSIAAPRPCWLLPPRLDLMPCQAPLTPPKSWLPRAPTDPPHSPPTGPVAGLNPTWEAPRRLTRPGHTGPTHPHTSEAGSSALAPQPVSFDTTPHHGNRLPACCLPAAAGLLWGRHSGASGALHCRGRQRRAEQSSRGRAAGRGCSRRHMCPLRTWASRSSAVIWPGRRRKSRLNSE